MEDSRKGWKKSPELIEGCNVKVTSPLPRAGGTSVRYGVINSRTENQINVSFFEPGTLTVPAHPDRRSFHMPKGRNVFCTHIGDGYFETVSKL